MSNARERLQSSARDLMRSLEQAISNQPNSSDSNSINSSPLKDGAAHIENALRMMFASCTSASDQNANDESVELSSSRSRSSTNHTEEESRNDRNDNFTAMQSHQAQMAGISSSSASQPPALASKDIGEHIYAQLFYDDHVRANKAVNSLLREQQQNQQQAQQQPAPPPPPATTSILPLKILERKNSTPLVEETTTRPIPKPFPVSSPVRATSAPLVLTSPIAHDELNIPECPTFDDGISAISAHTLEAMAQSYSRSRSDPTKNSKDFSKAVSIPENSHPDEPLFIPHSGEEDQRNTLGANRSPFYGIRRNPTWGSKNSGRHSLHSKESKGKNSQSTPTTASSSNSFENWKQQDAQYWEDVAQSGDDGSPHRATQAWTPSSSRRKLNKTSPKSCQDFTLSTSSSQTRSPSWSQRPFAAHPHDTIPLDATDFFDGLPSQRGSSNNFLHSPPDNFQQMHTFTDFGEVFGSDMHGFPTDMEIGEI